LNPRRKQLWLAWTPAILWVGIIALESSNIGASDNTSRILYPLFHFLFRMDEVAFAFWHHIIRKTGHCVGYAILTYFFFRAWRVTLPRIDAAAWSLRWARTSWFFTLLVATLDEWHQSYLPSRTGRWQDVVIDSSAALALQIFLWLALRKRKKSI
jgi:VanZ family protein